MIRRLLRHGAASLVSLYFVAEAQDFSLDFPPLVIDVVTPPVAVRTGGRYLLAHELRVTSWTSKPVVLERVEVLGPGSLLMLDGESLDQAFPHGMPHKAALPAGQNTVVLIALLVERPPKSLDHRVQFRIGEDRTRLTVEYRGTPVRNGAARIGPPVNGDSWGVANGPTGNNHHTGGLMPYAGRVRAPQRYALDMVRLYEGGKSGRGDPKDNRSYRCYGAEALAVAAGRVADVRDGIPENKPDPVERAVAMTPDTVTGNRVVLDLGKGRFAHYAHLQPWSIRVHKGDRVRRGQVLGLVGNSGNSTEPHLHFQISDGPTILQSDGLPYEFDRFERDGTPHRGELVRDGWVVSFPK